MSLILFDVVTKKINTRVHQKKDERRKLFLKNVGALTSQTQAVSLVNTQVKIVRSLETFSVRVLPLLVKSKQHPSLFIFPVYKEASEAV